MRAAGELAWTAALVPRIAENGKVLEVTMPKITNVAEAVSLAKP